jgi:hypothetical protein
MIKNIKNISPKGKNFRELELLLNNSSIVTGNLLSQVIKETFDHEILPMLKSNGNIGYVVVAFGLVRENGTFLTLGPWVAID